MVDHSTVTRVPRLCSELAFLRGEGSCSLERWFGRDVAVVTPRRPAVPLLGGCTLTLIDVSQNNGQARLAEMNGQVLANLDRMIGEIEKDTSAGAADAS
jgi:hypothetical protein